MSNQICNDHAPRPHNEAICHATGEKRQNIINKLKMILDQADDRPCLIQDVKQTSTRKPLMRFPGYVDYHHPAFKQEKLKDCRNSNFQQIPKMETNNYCMNGTDVEPTDTEIRSMPNDHNRMNMPAQQQDYYRPKEQELRGGEIFKNCFCIRANGVQDQCPLSDCRGKEECMAFNPGPCCRPALNHLCKMQKEKVQHAPKKVIQHEDHYQNRNKEDCIQNMNHEDKPKTLKCFYYYE